MNSRSALSLSNTEVEQKLQNAGLNPTAQRIALCRFILTSKDHPTAEEIKKWADANFPKVSLATVYNTLKALNDAHLVRLIRLPHSEKVFYDGDLTPHAHFLDTETGQVFDLEPDHVEVSLRLPKRFRVEHVEIIVTGRRQG